MALRDPVAVYNAATNFEAQFVCNLLNDAGVEAFVIEDASAAGIWMFGTLPEIHRPQVWVDRGSLALAKPVLDDYERRSFEALEAGASEAEAKDTHSEITFVCEECKQTITFPAQQRGRVEECPHCGSYVDVPEHAEQAPAVQAPGVADQLAAAQRTVCTAAVVPQATPRLWLEVFAVLCLAFIPDLFYAVAFLWHPVTASLVYEALSLLVRTFQVSAPLLVILLLTKEPLSQFGIVRPKWITDAVLGCAIWLGGDAAYYFTMSLLPPSMFEWSATWGVAGRLWAEGTAEGLLFLFASTASSFAEELVMRGYLIVRLQRLLRSTWLAVVVTTTLFASYHCYQGAVGVIGAGVIGLVYGTAFCLCRRLWPVCAAHAMSNLVGLW